MKPASSPPRGWPPVDDPGAVKGLYMALLLLALAIGLAFLESRREAYPDQASWRREIRISIVLGAAAALVDISTPGLPRATAFGRPAALAVAVFLADDLLYYLSHRLAHRVAVFWASHAVHHSPTRFDFFTGLRQPPTWLITPAAVAPLLLWAAGAPAALIALSASVRAVHHFLIHTERVRRLPDWVELIFNTPAHHRVHHSAESACLDRNFGGVLIIWDRLFGTFAAADDMAPGRYGLTHHPGDRLRDVVIGPWLALLAQVNRAPSTRAKLVALLGPPHAGV